MNHAVISALSYTSITYSCNITSHYYFAIQFAFCSPFKRTYNQPLPPHPTAHFQVPRCIPICTLYTVNIVIIVSFPKRSSLTCLIQVSIYLPQTIEHLTSCRYEHQVITIHYNELRAYNPSLNHFKPLVNPENPNNVFANQITDSDTPFIRLAETITC